MKQWLSIWNQPMKDSCSLQKATGGLFVISLFVAFFLWFFEPFGLSQYRGNTFWLTLRFGMITFVAGFIIEFVELKLFRLNKEHPSWKFKHWILSAMIVLLAISLGNFLFMNYLSGWDSLTWGYFFQFIGNTTAIGIFPLLVVGITSLKRNEITNTHLAEEIELPASNHADQLLTLPNNHGQNLEIRLSELLYLETMQNYVAVYFEKEDVVNKSMLRNTLKDILPKLPEDTVFQCHRSFAVNLDKITDIQGNSQGLTLTLSEGVASAPVSRKYIPELKSMVQQSA